MTAPAEPAMSPPLVEPGTRDWDETPAEAGRADRDHWLDRDYDTDTDRDEE